MVACIQNKHVHVLSLSWLQMLKKWQDVPNIFSLGWGEVLSNDVLQWHKSPYPRNDQFKKHTKHYIQLQWKSADFISMKLALYIMVYF